MRRCDVKNLMAMLARRRGTAFYVISEISPVDSSHRAWARKPARDSRIDSAYRWWYSPYHVSGNAVRPNPTAVYQTRRGLQWQPTPSSLSPGYSL
jgi:hypothetical protein